MAVLMPLARSRSVQLMDILKLRLWKSGTHCHHRGRLSAVFSGDPCKQIYTLQCKDVALKHTQLFKHFPFQILVHLHPCD